MRQGLAMGLPDRVSQGSEALDFEHDAIAGAHDRLPSASRSAGEHHVARLLGYQARRESHHVVGVEHLVRGG